LFRLCLVTDRKSTNGRPLVDVITAALRGGIDAVQLREKDLPARELHDLALSLRQLCTRHGATLLVNDRVDVAIAALADGIHLPVDSFEVGDARALAGDKLIGASTHSLAQAVAAEGAGANFIVFGPIFDTPSKRVHGAPVGIDALSAVTARVGIPVLAIGGITPERVEVVRERGAHGVAVVSGILAADDPEAAARAYRERISTA
jgi:thiamine-phosphate pyrophosphorylase